MPRYPRHQSLKAGFTLMETVVGLATTILIAAVLVSLFRVGMKTFIYTLRQTSVFTNARKMYEGDGLVHGFIWSARNAESFTDLSATALDLTAPDGSLPTFTLGNGTLSRTLQGTTVPLGTAVTTFTPVYYNLDSTGHIVVATNAAAASFVTVYVQTQSQAKKTFSFYSGTRLRNHL